MSDIEAENVTQADQDLQGRLAKRLKLLDSDTRAVPAWMAVEIGSHALLVPLNHSSEIVPWQRPTPVPYTQAWFIGVVNWRGDLSGVIDLSLYLDPNAPKRSEQALSQCKLLTFNPALETNAILLIDRMIGLKSISDFVKANEPLTNSRNSFSSFLGNFYTDTGGRIWQEINLQSLSQQTDFLSIRT